jgi:hypothetical protein
MENFKDDYVNRLQSPPHGFARAVLVDVLLIVVVVGVGLTLNSMVA